MSTYALICSLAISDDRLKNNSFFVLILQKRVPIRRLFLLFPIFGYF